jgi:hypothetical protein
MSRLPVAETQANLGVPEVGEIAMELIAVMFFSPLITPIVPKEVEAIILWR